MEFALKLWSTNGSLISAARELHSQKYFDRIELYAVPNSYRQEISKWIELEIPYIIHAPHFGHGFNLSLAENWEKNREMFGEARQYCETLNAKNIVVHLGTKGTLKESLRQLKELEYSKVVVENKPQIALDGTTCIGTSPENIKKAMETCDVGFCLDLSHATAYATFHKKNPFDILKEFIALKPSQYHLSDGLVQNIQDKHMNLGKGNYDLKNIFALLPKEALIVLETPKTSDVCLDVFVDEIHFIREHLS
ncbi:MAG: TIM barrel protein [Deltaproteobacteria bacterium]|nr:TIM barrel protein [Deltaproteobacteria bacterium]